MTIKDILPPEDVAALLEDVTTLTSGFGPPDVWRHRKKDGTVINVEITSHSLIFAGRPAWLVLANAVTERLRVEPEIRRLNVDFEITPALTVNRDLRWLRVVMENLLDNAWKFTAKKTRGLSLPC